MHADEIQVDSALARRLVATQFPAFAGKSIVQLTSSGSSNVLFWLGEDLLVRLPRQPGGGDAILKEATWLPWIAERLSVSVPETIATGRPTPDYSESWSIVSWIDGEHPVAGPINTSDDSKSDAFANDIADLLIELRGIEIPDAAIQDARLNSYRGEPLAGFDEQMRANIEACRPMRELDLDLDHALEIWEQALQLPGASDCAPNRWFHGDLVAENLLLSNGRLSAVLDFGGLSIGDPTVDLHGVWEVLNASGRSLVRSRLEVEDSEWLRGRAWALAIGLGTLPYYWTSMPSRCRDRLAMIRAVLANGDSTGESKA